LRERLEPPGVDHPRATHAQARWVQRGDGCEDGVPRRKVVRSSGYGDLRTGIMSGECGTMGATTIK
jgi:hypothetical protein